MSATKVISYARRFIGTTERPRGSNDDGGGPITRWNARYGLRRVPWCGTSSGSWYGETGVWAGGLDSPSTFAIVEQARRAGRLRSEPVPGCFVVWRPGASGHVELFQRWIDKSRGAALTIGGNTGDAVREHVRGVRGAYFAVPPSIEAPPEPVYRDVYFWECPGCEPTRHGLYATTASREKAVRAWVARNGNPGHVRRGKLSLMVNGRLVPRWTFWTGPRKRSADFATKSARDRSAAAYQRTHPGARLRSRSKRVRVS
jgi:hypothetical protein